MYKSAGARILFVKCCVHWILRYPDKVNIIENKNQNSDRLFCYMQFYNYDDCNTLNLLLERNPFRKQPLQIRVFVIVSPFIQSRACVLTFMSHFYIIFNWLVLWKKKGAKKWETIQSIVYQKTLFLSAWRWQKYNNRIKHVIVKQ